MYCKKCGKQISDDSDFCRFCGASVITDTAEKEIAEKPVKRRKADPVVLVGIFALLVAAAAIVITQVLPQYNSDLKVTELENGTVAISGYNGRGGAVTIPEKLHFKTVTEISANAFSNNDTITSIKMPNSIITIGDSAFNDCDSLTTVQLPYQLRSIGAESFRSCDMLAALNGTYTFSVDHIGMGAFMDCTKLYSYIPATESIGDMAYANCGSIETYSIRSRSIGTCAFENCTGLTELTIDSENINIGAFENCKELTKVEILTEKTSIPSMCFNSCSKLRSFTAKELSIVDEGAFNACSSLSDFSCSNPNTVDIAYNAFDGCIYDPFPDPDPIITMPEESDTDYCGFDYADMSFYDIDALFNSSYEYFATKNHYMINDNASLSVYPFYDAVETYGIYLQGSGVTIDGWLTLGHDMDYYEDYFDLTLYDDLYTGAGEYGTTWQEFVVITTTWDGRKYRQTYRVTDDGTYTVYGVTITRTE